MALQVLPAALHTQNDTRVKDVDTKTEILKNMSTNKWSSRISTWHCLAYFRFYDTELDKLQ